MGPEIKNDCAGDGYQQFIGLDSIFRGLIVRNSDTALKTATDVVILKSRVEETTIK
jgi:hypothetical protein